LWFAAAAEHRCQLGYCFWKNIIRLDFQRGLWIWGEREEEKQEEDEDEDEIGSWCLEQLTSSYLLVTIWLASWWGGYSIT
jgi:hypothetical protein